MSRFSRSAVFPRPTRAWQPGKTPNAFYSCSLRLLPCPPPPAPQQQRPGAAGVTRQAQAAAGCGRSAAQPPGRATPRRWHLHPEAVRPPSTTSWAQTAPVGRQAGRGKRTKKPGHRETAPAAAGPPGEEQALPQHLHHWGQSRGERVGPGTAGGCVVFLHC